MKIAQIVNFLESIAPLHLQESYDNAGLITGQSDWNCSGVLCTLDCIEETITEAIDKKCNLIVAHHPIVFSGLKKINGANYVERTIIKAIKNDIAIYAIHTNLDNVISGVNGVIANKLGLQNRAVLLPKSNQLKKLITYVPLEFLDKVREAIFEAGAGEIGAYSECSFSSLGTGTFKAGSTSNPFVGEKGQRHQEEEYRLEVVLPSHLSHSVLDAVKKVHPYEEVAYDIISLANIHQEIGSGLVGELSEAVDEQVFLQGVKEVFGVPTIRHTALLGRKIKRVALCGGSGSFLINNALGSKADIFLTADMKYHQFFDADAKLVITDIGHFEIEQFTTEFLQAEIAKKFPNFAVLKTAVNTNPVRYF
jgi:dinuclear metal center YbgI/SA1388 family protein